MARTRLTGFSRFLIFMLFAAPLAYFGAQYIQSHNLLDTYAPTITTVDEDNDNSLLENPNVEQLVKENKALRSEVEALKTRLKDQIEYSNSLKEELENQ